MNQKLVSIIIPSFNRADLIGETLDSILNQSYTNWECIVVDDGSSDDTIILLPRYTNKDKRIRFYKRPTQLLKGANACRNYGLELSKGYYINWIDSDDVMHVDKLKNQIFAIETGSFDFSVCQSLMFSNHIGDSTELRSEKIISKQPLEDYITKKLIIPIQAPVFKRSFLDANNLRFNELLQAGQEWEMFTRVFFCSENYKAVEQPLDYIRRHTNSISGCIRHKEKWNYVLARHEISTNYKSSLTPKVKQYLQFFYFKNLKDFLRNGYFNEAFFIWKQCLINDSLTSIKNHLLIGCSFISFYFFKKGDMFLTKVK